MRLIIEEVLSMLPFKKCIINTPQEFQYEGRRMDVKQVNYQGQIIDMNIWIDNQSAVQN